MRRLEKDPKILKEYGNIIADQLPVGMIENVVELEKAPGFISCLAKQLFAKS